MSYYVNRRSFEEVEGNGSWHPGLRGLVGRVEGWCREGAGGAVSVFDARWVPEMSVNDYMVRVCKYGMCSPGVFAAMEVYLERANAKLPITPHNVHRLLLAALITAAKYVDDTRISLQHYANLAGIPLKEVNQIEAAFITLLEWDLSVSASEAESTHCGSNQSTPVTSLIDSESPATLMLE
eukprot:TRINITY_DN17120_c0_g1_i1.p1 TRINITY_DN17120_c0_g1~~TRINITY_DN17120_c0_g1_i1.p1  ORF type:complete len:181 (+),score=30.74 TRINITY_DN17120_c0_g1_i1:3-545(+)